MTRNERQHISITKILDSDFYGILNLAPRFGKTRIGLNAAKLYQSKYPGRSILIITPNHTVRQEWINQMSNVEFEIQPIIATAAQATSIEGFLRTGLLIVDECHKFISPSFYRLINGDIIKHDENKLIMLTGTMPTGNNEDRLTNLAPIIDVIDDKEAILNGWISNYIEYNIPLEFNSGEKTSYVSLTKTISLILDKYKNLSRFITYDGVPLFTNDMELLYGCINGYNSKLIGHISSDLVISAIHNKMCMNEDAKKLWDINVIKDEAIAFSVAIKKRNLIITNSFVKRDAVIKLLKTVNKKTIVFSDNSIFADNLYELYKKEVSDRCTVYHTNLKSKALIDYNTGDYFRYKTGQRMGEPKVFSIKMQLEYIKELFRCDLLDVIFAVKALDEGITIPNLECVITTSGSTNSITHTQRTARSKTYVDDNKLAKIYNLYFDDFVYDGELVKSRDKVKLIERQDSNINILNIQLDDV